MKIFVLLALLIFATAAFPQSANVVELEAADAAGVEKAWVQLQAAQTIWELKQAYIQRKYIERDVTCAHNPDWKAQTRYSCDVALSVSGFENGFEFSKDFRFIVPKQSSGVTHAPCSTTGSVTYWDGCITLTPGTVPSTFGY